MTPVYKLSASSIKGRTNYGSMLAGNSVFVPDLGVFESIATVSVGSGGAADVEFTSIPGTYTHLQVRALHVTASAGSSATLRFNGDTTAANYRQHSLIGTGSAASANTISSNLYAPYDSGGAATTSPGSMVLDILDYSNTNKNTTIRYLNGYDANGSGVIQLISGLWLSTAAITSIKFTLSFSQYTQFALYGIRSA